MAKYVEMRIKIVFAACVISAIALEFKYHSNVEMEDYLKKYTARFPYISRLYSIGKSKNGTNLWVMHLSSRPNATTLPHVKLIGNIHGNEPVGREILLHFLEFLGENYSNNSTISWLLDNTNVHVLPSLNPDGFHVAQVSICEGDWGRKNMDNADLNRNFPDFYHRNFWPRQPETEAVIAWLREIPFVLSACLHGGALVANYPFDTVKQATSVPGTQESVTPDDDVFRFLAKSYARNHETMHLGKKCDKNDKSPSFVDGITNGAQWYTFQGGMQDYNYAFCGCMELTLELSCCKYPRPGLLQGLWKENQKALLEFCKQSHTGVKGIIINKQKNATFPIDLQIEGREMTFRSSARGEFWRILLPGKYNLKIAKSLIPFEVEKSDNNFPKATFLQVLLEDGNAALITSTTTTTTKQIATTEKMSAASATEELNSPSDLVIEVAERFAGQSVHLEVDGIVFAYCVFVTFLL